jgi:NADPH:quinone reductase-like Zn-dependent oxidoreductase
VGATTFARCKDALSEKGVFIPLENDLREILQAIFTSRSAGRKVKFGISKNTREGLETIMALIEAGTLRPVVDHVYPMSEIAEAHRHVEGRHKRGSVIVTTG